MTNLTFAALLFLIQGGAEPAGQAERPKASIEGVILRSESGEPLARAEVKLSRVLPPESTGIFSFGGGDPETQGLPSVLTEADGRFLLKNLEPGQYRLSVTRNGYTSQSYGQKSPFGSGRIINLASGEALRNIVFRMIQAGIVTGRVRDSTGEPVAGLEATLMRIDYSNNQRKLFAMESVRTDDRGEYRFFWIQPGRYYVRVNRTQGYGPRTKVIVDPNIPTTYYPGTLNATTALPIEVVAGRELGAVDIVLPKSTGHWIRGRVVDAATGKPPKGVDLSIRPKESQAVFDSDALSSTPSYDPATGAFSIRNVPPGLYWLSAGSSIGFDEPLAPDRLAEIRTGADIFESVWATGAAGQVAIDMPVADLNDVVIILKLGASIPVRVRVEGSDLSGVRDIDKVRFILEPVAEVNAFQQSTRVSSEGAARFDNVFPGEYKARTNLPKSTELYVKEFIYGRSDALAEPVHIADSQPGTFTVLLSNRGGRVEGTVTDAFGQPVSGIDVVLVPDRRERTDLFQTVNTDRDGHFAFSALTPGGYKVFSWESLPEDQYQDKEVLSKYETQGRPVQVQENSKLTVDLRIIPEAKQ